MGNENEVKREYQWCSDDKVRTQELLCVTALSVAPIWQSAYLDQHTKISEAIVFLCLVFGSLYMMMVSCVLLSRIVNSDDDDEAVMEALFIEYLTDFIALTQVIPITESTNTLVRDSAITALIVISFTALMDTYTLAAEAWARKYSKKWLAFTMFGATVGLLAAVLSPNLIGNLPVCGVGSLQTRYVCFDSGCSEWPGEFRQQCS